MLAAWAVEVLFGYPDWVYRRIRHPVVWAGSLIDLLEQRLNRPKFSDAARYGLGALNSVAVVTLAAGAAMGISLLLPATAVGTCLEALIASSLICSRSLYAHVAAVSEALGAGDLAGARSAVARIVGRETAQMKREEIAGAAIESLSENASDGVVAPVFWGVLLGLPGLAAYKAINTLDSMIGHRDERHAAFGGFAARLDDLANLIPARVTGFLFATASLRPAAFGVMWRDAPRHRSPNAGWPEGAAAGALGVRLSGPRVYGSRIADEPWLNAPGSEPGQDDLRRGLKLYCRAMILGGAVLAGIALPRWMS